MNKIYEYRYTHWEEGAWRQCSEYLYSQMCVPDCADDMEFRIREDNDQE